MTPLTAFAPLHFAGTAPLLGCPRSARAGHCAVRRFPLCLEGGDGGICRRAGPWPAGFWQRARGSAEALGGGGGGA